MLGLVYDSVMGSSPEADAKDVPVTSLAPTLTGESPTTISDLVYEHREHNDRLAKWDVTRRPATVSDLVDSISELGAEVVVLRDKHRTHWQAGTRYLVFRIDA